MSVADAELIYLHLLFTVCNASMRVTFASEQAAAHQCLLAACQLVFASLRQIFDYDWSYSLLAVKARAKIIIKNITAYLWRTLLNL